MMSEVGGGGSRKFPTETVHGVAGHLPGWLVLASVASKHGPLGLPEVL